MTYIVDTEARRIAGTAYLKEHNPARLAELNAKAVEILEQYRNGTDGTIGVDEAIGWAFNTLAGMCGDGCCGGAYELGGDDEDKAAHEHIMRLRARAWEVVG